MIADAKAFAVIAEFSVSSEKRDAFLDAAEEDARSSRAVEPGCRQFDVHVAEGDPMTVVFYEVYDSRAAFEAHLKTPHLAAFRKTLTLVEREMPPRFLEVIGPKAGRKPS